MTACKADHLYSLERESVCYYGELLIHYSASKDLYSFGLLAYKLLLLKLGNRYNVTVIKVLTESVKINFIKLR